MDDNSEQRCAAHDGEPIGACGQCAAPICEQCRREFGYFCGEACLNNSLGSVDHEAKARFQESTRSFHVITRIVKYVFLAVLIAVVAAAGWLVWNHFLDPAGKVAWQWRRDFKYEALTSLRESSSGIVLKIGDEVVAVDPNTGAEQKSAENPKIAEYSQLLKKYSPGVLFAGETSAAMIGYGGEIKWRVDFGGAVSDAAAGVSVLMARVAVEAENGRETKKIMGETVEIVEYDHYLVCVAVLDGRVLGRRKLEKRVSFANNLFVGDDRFAYSANEQVDNRLLTVLRVGDLASGKTIWKIKLDASIGWGPRIINDSVVLQTGNNLMAISLDGKSKLWSLPVKGYFLRDEMRITDDYLFVSGSESIACVDLKKNKTLWDKKAPFYPETFEYDAGRVYISGTVTTKQEGSAGVTLPKRFKELQDDDVIKGIVGKGVGGKVTYDGVVICYDAATGEELWRLTGVRGSLVVGAGRVVVVTDTAVTSRMNLANKGKGLTIIRQLDPRSGSVLYQRTNSLGLMEPFMILGGKLVAVEFERVKTGIGAIAFGGGEDLHCLGLAAIKLR